MRRVEFTVEWPLQGLACFSTRHSRLILSDVYWRWIFEALFEGQDETRLPEFVRIVQNGFADPSHLTERIPVTSTFLAQVRGLVPSYAPSFEHLIPRENCPVPSPEQVLNAFVAILEEGLIEGHVEMSLD